MAPPPAPVVAHADDLENDPVWTALQNAPRLTEDDLTPEEWAAWDESIADYKAGSAQLVGEADVQATIERMRGRAG